MTDTTDKQRAQVLRDLAPQPLPKGAVMIEPSDEARALAYRIDHEHALAGAENREPTYEVALLLDAALAVAWDQGHKYAQERDRYAHTVARVEKLADEPIYVDAWDEEAIAVHDLRAALRGDES